MKGKVLYRETQTFRGVPFYAIVAFSIVTIISPIFFKFYNQIVLGVNDDLEPMNDNSLILVTFFVTAIVTGILTMVYIHKLDTEIDAGSIRYRFAPYFSSFRTIKKEDIKEVYVRKYSPIFEYGGWGYRWGFAKGRAYNIWGNKGLQIVFKNDKKLLIGTQKPEELNNIIEDWKKEGKYG